MQAIHRVENIPTGRFLLFALCLVVAPLIAQSSEISQKSAQSGAALADLFEPKKSEYAALSPDGKYLAFSERDGENMYLSLIEVDKPDVIAGKALVGTDMTATPYMQIRRKERTPARIRWIRWITPEILLLQTNQRFQNALGAIVKLDANAWEGKLIVEPTDFIYSRHLKILDLDPDNDEQVYLRNGGSSEFDLYTLNVRTEKLKYIRRESSVRTRAVLFNRQHEPGITIPKTSLARRPFRYLFYLDESESLFKKWQPMETVIESEKSGPFVVSYENFLRDRSIPVGFDETGKKLFVATNSGRDTYAIKSLDLDSGLESGILLQDEDYDLVNPVLSLFPDNESLVYDRFNREFLGIRYPARHYTAKWIDPDLDQLQREFESMYPEKSVEILDWNRSRNRFLVRTYSHVDRGAIRVFSLDSGTPEELVRIIDKDKPTPPRSIGFAYDLPKGGEISGFLTLPNDKQGSVPAILRFPSGPWMRVNPFYDPAREFLAMAGFAVIDFNGRGATGLGKVHANLVRDGYVEHQASDIHFLIEKLATEFPVDPGNVALIGDSYGGFGALFTAQEFQEQFRAVAAIQSPLEPPEWLLKERWSNPPFKRNGITAHLLGQFFNDPNAPRNVGLRKKLSKIEIPSLFMASRGSSIFDAYHSFNTVVRRIRSNGGKAELVELHPDYFRHLPEATAETYSRIVRFFEEAMDLPYPDPGQESSLASAMPN